MAACGVIMWIPENDHSGGENMENAMELIRARHSVRQYLDKKIPEDIREKLNAYAAEWKERRTESCAEKHISPMSQNKLQPLQGNAKLENVFLPK